VDDRRLADLADANLFATAQASAIVAGGEAWDDSGVVVAAAGGPLRSLNQAFITEAASDLVATLQRVRAYFAERGLRYRVRLREELVERCEPALLEAGFEPQGGIPSLALHPIECCKVADGLEIASVTDERTLRDHIAVVAAGFEWAPDVLGHVFTNALIGHPQWRAYAGYVDGRPVAASQLFVTEDAAGVYYVATLPEARRKSYGEAMTRHAIAQGAAAGCAVATLQASPMGLPIYGRMGFRHVGYYRTYVQVDVDD
jgi:ribosomal protein S18 acetylase RimI-like enzyme